MSKLHAQMALLGTIDEVVRDAEPEIVKMVETFLPGTTGVGQQGWYRELKRFVNRDELLPRDPAGTPIKREQPVVFPSYGEAIAELTAAPRAGEAPASPAVQARAMYAATILSRATRMQGQPPIEVDPSFEEFPDPLDALMPAITREFSAALPEPQSSEPDDPAEALKFRLRTANTRQEYVDATQGLARSGVLDPQAREVLNRPVVCTGALRKAGGQYCTLLTTDWSPPFTLDQITEIIDPHNWPELCDFFVRMDDQAPLTPDRSRGWSRKLEIVSGDRTQWQMRTALRFWSGTTAGGGIYLNYDLDNPRVNDSNVVEVDAGYIWVTPPDPKSANPSVRIRTCKEVRIRGVSATATAALACGFGWGDAMSQMFAEGVEDPPAGRRVFTPSVDPGPPDPSDTNQAAAQAGGDDAEDVELVEGWRGAIIEAMRVQMRKGIETADSLGTDFADRWSDGNGLSLDDVTELGKKYGGEVTEYATGVFKAAAAALQPQDATATGGNN